MRLLLLAVPSFLLTACDMDVRNKAENAQSEQHAEKVDRAKGRIECMAPGERAFTLSCAVDFVNSQDGLFLTIRHQDGGFRRLRVTRDGRGVTAADGAEQAIVSVTSADLIEVELGGMRYRLPATVRQPKAAE